MFAPNIVGTANATSAGWGNLGGGANRLGMPLIAAAVVSFGVADEVAWRYSMVIAGIVCFLMGLVYYFFTQDTPEGNFAELRKTGNMPVLKKDKVSFVSTLKDYRVWILFLVYAACFGMELTVYGTMDDYLQNTFGLERITAGNIVLSFALMNIFARTLGGFFGDRFGKLKGLRGRVLFLTFLLMAEGATFSVVPFINKKAIGSISGIVGAGGNVGAFLAALFLKSKSAMAERIAIKTNEGLGEEAVKAAQAAAASSAVSSGYFIIGIFVVVAAISAFAIKFSTADEEAVLQETEGKMAISTVES